MSLLKSAVVFLLLTYYTQAQEGMCEMITEADLIESPNGGTTPGLLLRTYTTNLNPSDPSIRLKDFTIVCMAAGPKRDTYRFVSIVAEQECRGNLCPDGHRDETKLVQYDFECDPDTNEWSIDVLGSTNNIRDDNPTADLDTELRTDCGACASKIPGSDPMNHCVECVSVCDEGAKLCGRFTKCCAYYDDDMCVEECPDDKVAYQDNFTCIVPVDCGPAPAPLNGTILVGLTDATKHNSKANYTCDEGLIYKSGDLLLICEATGEWSGTQLICEMMPTTPTTTGAQCIRQSLMIVVLFLLFSIFCLN